MVSKQSLRSAVVFGLDNDDVEFDRRASVSVRCPSDVARSVAQ